MDTLINRFEKASSALELRDVPLFADRSAQTEDSVQIDIAHEVRKHRAGEISASTYGAPSATQITERSSSRLGGALSSTASRSST